MLCESPVTTPCESPVTAGAAKPDSPRGAAATPATTSGSLTPPSLAQSPESAWSTRGEASPQKILFEGPPGLAPPQQGCVGSLPVTPALPGSPTKGACHVGAKTQRQEIVEAATALVRAHLDQGAEAMVSEAWKRGQLFFRRMQEQQLAQAASVQQQLVACAAAQRLQQQEHQALQQTLDVLVQRLDDVIAKRDGAPPAAPARPGVSPTGGAPLWDAAREAGALSLAKSLYGILASRPGRCCLLSDVGALLPGELRQRLKEQGGLRKFLNKHAAVFAVAGEPGRETVAIHPQRRSAEPRSKKALGKEALPTVQEHSGESSMDSDGASVSGSSHGDVETFAITLRCADDVGLGLEVSAARGGDHLTVVAALPGGAVASWNKACGGGARQVCAQDRIVEVNGARSSEEMLAQVRERLLLKLQVQRGAAVQPDAPAEVLRLVI